VPYVLVTGGVAAHQAAHQPVGPAACPFFLMDPWRLRSRSKKPGQTAYQPSATHAKPFYG
jgi:hypothetical protein